MSAYYRAENMEPRSPLEPAEVQKSNNSNSQTLTMNGQEWGRDTQGTRWDGWGRLDKESRWVYPTPTQTNRKTNIWNG